MTDDEVIEMAEDFLTSRSNMVTNDPHLLRQPLLRLRCKLQREYFEGREKLRIPKGKEYTDFDRNTMLEASVAELREKYEYVKGLEELVRERVELYKLMMKEK